MTRFLGNVDTSARFYASSNGTLSVGWLIRTSKGVYADKYDGTGR